MFATFDQMIEDYGLQHVYGDDRNGQRRAVKVLVAGIRLSQLCATFQNDLKFGKDQSAKFHIDKAYKVILRLTKEHEPARVASLSNKQVNSINLKEHLSGRSAVGKEVNLDSKAGKLNENSKEVPDALKAKFKDKPVPAGGCLIFKRSIGYRSVHSYS